MKTSKPIEVGLSLGSNLGNRLENLQDARNSISMLDGLRIVSSSPVYETEPVDVPERFAEKSFLNAVLIVECSVPLSELHGKLRKIEADMGRLRKAERNSPRPVDIDIIYAGNHQVQTPELHIPHPRWSERRFVVQPLACLRPDLKLPGSSETVSEVLAHLPAKPNAVLLDERW